MACAGLEDLGDDLLEMGRPKWFFEKGGCAELLGFALEHRAASSGHQNDGKFLAQCDELLQKLDATGFGQLYVRDKTDRTGDGI